MLLRHLLLAVLIIVEFRASNGQTDDEICSQENSAINSNADVVDVFDTYAMNREQRFLDCVEGGSFLCDLIADGEEYALETACEGAGGDYEAILATFDCFDLFYYPWTILYPYFFCFGYSCSEESIFATYDEVLLSKSLEFFGAGLTCDYNYQRFDVDTGAPMTTAAPTITTAITEAPTATGTLVAAPTVTTAPPTAIGTTATPVGTAAPQLTTATPVGTVAPQLSTVTPVGTAAPRSTTATPVGTAAPRSATATPVATAAPIDTTTVTDTTVSSSSGTPQGHLIAVMGGIVGGLIALAA